MKSIEFGMKIKVYIFLKYIYEFNLLTLKKFCLDILASKRRQYSDLAHKINETKSLIDHTRIQVETKRTERMAMGDFISEFGESVIDEEEFSLIKRLQELKGRYRDDFEKWRDLKTEIVYCQNLVEQCRQRLVQGLSKK